MTAPKSVKKDYSGGFEDDTRLHPAPTMSVLPVASFSRDGLPPRGRAAWAAVLLAGAAIGLPGVGDSIRGQDGPPSNDGVATDRPKIPTTEGPAIEVWVERLGDPDFLIREEATERLREIGLAAIGPLERAAAHPERETRFRAERLLHDLYEQDLAIKVDLFRQHNLPDEKTVLPLWATFQARHGDTDATRSLFADVLQREGMLLRQMQKYPDQAASLLQRLAGELTEPGVIVPRGTAVLLLFAVGEGLLTPDEVTHQGLYAAVKSPAFQELTQPPESRTLANALFLAWAEQTRGMMAFNALEQARQTGLPAGRTLAIRELTGDRAPAAHILQSSILLLARLGEPDDRAVLVPYLDDETILNERDSDQKPIVTKVRDLALAASIHLAGGDVTTEGFSEAKANPVWTFLPNSLGFPSDEARATARAAYEAKYPLAKAPTESADGEERP